MKNIILICLLLIKTSFLLGNEAKPLTSDVGVFRLPQKVFFLEDIKKICHELNLINCIDNQLLITMAIEISAQDLSLCKRLQTSNLDENWGIILKIMKLAKILYYLFSQNIIIKKEIWQSFLQKGVERKCFKDPKMVTSGVKDILKGELFLNSRFSKLSVMVSKTEIKDYRASHTQIRASEDDITKLIVNKKIKRALSLFVSSLHKQISDYSLWK